MITVNGYHRNGWVGIAEIGNSEDRIEVYLGKWNKSYVTNYTLQNNDTVKTIYEIFDVFYTPRDLKRIGESE